MHIHANLIAPIPKDGDQIEKKIVLIAPIPKEGD